MIPTGGEVTDKRAKESTGQEQLGCSIGGGMLGGGETSSEPSVSVSESKVSDDEITLVKTSSWGCGRSL